MKLSEISYGIDLTEGKFLHLGASKNAAHCVCVRIVQDWLEYSPVLITQIVMLSQSMVSTLTGQPLPRSYYRTRMELISLVRQVVASRQTTFSYKLMAVMALLISSHFLQWPDLQHHLNAINDLLESAAKARNFTLRENEGPTLRPQWLVGMFLVNEFRIAAHHDLQAAKSRFLADLNGIQKWTAKTVAWLLLRKDGPKAIAWEQMLAQLISFLAEPLEARLVSTDLPFGVAAAPFFCCYSICVTFVHKEMNPIEALNFLSCVQRKLIMIDHGCSKGGTALAHMLADARLETSTVGEQQEHILEVNISQSLINALKLYKLLSTATRMRITESLHKAALIMVRRSLPDLTDVQALTSSCEREIEDQWWLQQPLHTTS